MSRLLLLLLLCISSNFRSQQELEIRWGNKPFVLDTLLVLNDSTQLRISQLKFYLQVSERRSTPRIIFVDAADSNKITFNNMLNSLQLGIDPALQMQSNFKGTLDPIHGMYWAWNSGYIQLKCAGELIVGNSKKVQHFELHLGGLEAPWICSFPIVGEGNLVIFDVAIWLSNLLVNREEIPVIMQPSATSVALFNLAKNAFYYAR